ncbi:MAG: DcaP family trimeric outer membrane transporter [Ignavibacteriaceae bacterium]
MKKILLLLGCISSLLFSQTEKQTFGITFSGFVKTDLMYDSRQTVSIREGHFLLYPQNENPDAQGNDINDKSSFNMLSIQTRLNGKITGPAVLNAKTSGVIEGEFFGHSDADINGFRLRHAFVKLDWERTSLLAGQTWHPLFIAEMFPGVVSFNTGVPFQPFSRNPQVRFTHSIDNLKFIAVALSQRDFTSNGPSGFTSTYIRNSVVPNLHAQVQYSGKGIFGGAGVDYKKITPRLVTTKNIKTDNSISSLAFTGFTKLNIDPVAIKVQGIYGGNLADQLMLGGYAVSTVDTLTGIEGYTAINCFSVWVEISAGKDIEYAVFAGYTKNLGAEDNILGAYYGRGINIENVLRVSPRIQFNFNKLRISTELEYTSAGYGTANNLDKGKIENIKDFINLRILGAVYLFF